MAAALQCDRCGALFMVADPKNMSAMYVHMDDVWVKNGKKAQENSYIRWRSGIDFCPECSKWLLAFLNIDEKEG